VFVGREFDLHIKDQPTNNMKATLLGTSLLFLFSLAGQAQLKGFSLGPYAEMGWPAGNFQTTHKTGIGAGLGADIRLGKLGITGSVGYMHFPGQTLASTEGGSSKEPALAAVPIRVGLKFRPIPLIFFKVEGGVANYTKDRGTALIFAPAVGVRLLGLEVQAKYETWRKNENLSFWGMKVGYNF
jgi:hypothetical protein